MNTTPHFPDDENGRVLRRMYDCGDSLTRSRIVEFCFVFSQREQALAFVRDVDDRDFEICLSWYEEKSVWQAMIRHDMVPDHGRITELESTLTLKANRSGGTADGWGCMLPFAPSRP